MAEYRTIAIRFWSDAFVEALPASGKLLYLYLFTSPHTSNLGILDISTARMAFDTGLPESDVDAILDGFERTGKIVRRDGLTWVASFIRNQTSTSPKILTALSKLTPKIPSRALSREIWAHYPAIFASEPEPVGDDTVSIPYADAADTLSDGHGGETDAPDRVDAPARPPCPYQEIVALYHEICTELPQVQILTEKRKRTIAARWREDASRRNLAWWRWYFERVAASRFLCGHVEPKPGKLPFLADLDWITNAANMVHIIEGRYTRSTADGSLQSWADGVLRQSGAADIEAEAVSQ